MRALRGLTATTMAALLVVSAATGAVADDPDGGPTAEVVPGVGVSYVGWPPVHESYVGEWSGADAVPVSRQATTAELVFPEEFLELPFADVSIGVDAVGATRGHLANLGSDLASGTFTLDLHSMLLAATSYGITDVSSLELEVTRVEPDVTVDLLIVLQLVDGASGPAQLTLGVPPSKSYDQVFRGTEAKVVPGGRITVMAWSGFFGPDAPEPLAVRVYQVGTMTWVDVTDPVTVSADGVSVSMPVPSAYGPGGDLEISLGGASQVSYSVLVSLWPAPSDAVEAYVTAVYNDLFGRDPDPTGLAGWSDALMRGVPYSAVSDAITSSDEFRMGLIAEAYAKYLGRVPDHEGLLGWLRAMNRGLHIQQMEAGFLASQEYFDVWGEGTNAGWIQSLYIDVLHREAAPAEVQAWLPSIARDGREVVARGFLYSTEKLETDVDGYYQWLLRRPLDDVGRAGWVRAIQGGHRVEEIIAGIIASPEYRTNVPVG